MGYKDFLRVKLDKKPDPKAEPHGQVMSTVMPPFQSPNNPFATPGGTSPSSSVNGSRAASINTDKLHRRSEALDTVKNQVMINYLYQQQGNNGWRSPQTTATEGVMLRVARESYLSFPPELIDTPLANSLRDLNIQVCALPSRPSGGTDMSQAAMTIYSPVIKSYLDSMPGATDIPLLNGLAVQVVPKIEMLARARTHQFAAVVASEALLVVWDDDALNMLTRAKTIEWELMQLLWTSDPFSSKVASKIDLTINEKDSDLNSEEAAAPKPRPTVFINTVLVSISLCCIIGTLGLGLRQLVVEYLYEDGFNNMPYIRFVFLILTPIWMFLSVFFFNVIVINCAELIGPIQQMTTNSKHYSAHTVPRITHNLPHVTIQCPVYKEGLNDVILPTVVSIKKAISTYELQGGSANIFVNDDGMQLISEADRTERMAFYADHGIGWVARPGHSADANGFKRKGKFKKASNMNFALAISCSMEDKLNELKRGPNWTSSDEAEATAWALEQAVAETDGIAWADGNIRIGDYILISKLYLSHHSSHLRAH